VAQTEACPEYPNRLAMIIPYSVDVPMERIPVANWVLIGVTILVTIGAWFKEAHDRRLGGDVPAVAPDSWKRTQIRQREAGLQRKLREMERKGASPEEVDALLDDMEAFYSAPPLSLQPHEFSFVQLYRERWSAPGPASAWRLSSSRRSSLSQQTMSR